MKATKIISACAVLAALASCSNEHELSQQSAEDTPATIRFETSVGGQKTKAVNDASELQDTQFKDGEKIRIFLREHLLNGETAIKSYSPLDGTTSTSESTHKITFSDAPTFPSNGRGVDCLAIYPQKDTASTSNIDYTHDTFTVYYDQSSQDNYRNSDLMWAYKGNTKKSDKAVKLEFTHLLSKIMVKVKCDASVDNKVLDDIYVDLLNTCKTIDIEVPEVKQSTTVAQSGGEMTDLKVKIADTPNPQNPGAFYLGKADKATSGDETKQVSAIIVPQNIAKDKKFFKIKLNKGTGAKDYATYTYTVSDLSGLTFEGGKKYEYTITLKAGGIDVESVKIKDWGVGIADGSGDATLD